MNVLLKWSSFVSYKYLNVTNRKKEITYVAYIIFYLTETNRSFLPP